MQNMVWNMPPNNCNGDSNKKRTEETKMANKLFLKIYVFHFINIFAHILFNKYNHMI